MASCFSWPCRAFGLPTFKNSWFFAIFKTLARPSADFGLVDLRKLVVFCDFQIARATLCRLWAGRPSKTRGFLRFSKRSRTLCGLWACQPSKTRGFLRFSDRPRNPLRTLGWSTFENSWFFAIFTSPTRPSAEFRVVKSLSLWRGAHFLEAVNPKPLPSQGICSRAR